MSFTLQQICNDINNVADESETIERITAFINDAIATINTKADTLFPFMDASQAASTFPFPDKWVRTLIIPFGVGRLKTVDASQFEYTDQYQDFMDALGDFMIKYIIPDMLKDSGDGVTSVAAAQAALVDGETLVDPGDSDVFINPPYPWGF